MLFSSFFTRSMVFAYFAKAQLPFSLFRDLFNDTAEFTLCYGLHDCSHLFQGYFIHSLSTLYYYNAPSLTTRLTGDYRDRTYTGKCSPALLDTRKRKALQDCSRKARSLSCFSDSNYITGTRCIAVAFSGLFRKRRPTPCGGAGTATEAHNPYPRRSAPRI